MGLAIKHVRAGFFLVVVFCLLWAVTLPVHAADETVSVWLTTPDQTSLLSQQGNISFDADSGTNPTTVNVDENTTYQTMDGFGAAVTGSAGYLINQNMSAGQRDSLLNDLFTSSGINLSFVRQPIGASDFAPNGSYTYDDIASGTDYDLNNFSIANDSDMIATLQAALNKHPGLKVLGTPWTAPAWMKNDWSLNGSYLKYWDSATYQSYANYFVKYIQAYGSQGIPIYAITVQNEPENATSNYPSMSMGAPEERDFIKNYLGPTFSSNDINTKILDYDHNWDDTNYASIVLSDSSTAQYVDGTAFHCYAGDVSGQTTVHNNFPNKNIYFTECSGGDWSTDFGSNLKWNMSNLMIGAVRNWAKTVLMWNLALDTNDGPTNGGCSDCRGVVTIDQSNGNYTRNVEYYTLGHVSKFVNPGAVRIDSNSYSGGIENVAFKNPDGSKVLVALNNGSSTNTFKVKWGGESFSYTLPAGAVVTFKWNGMQSGGSTGGVPIGQTIWLKSDNGSYVTAWANDTNTPLYAKEPNVSTWEEFQIVDAGDGYIALKALANNLYVTAAIDQSGNPLQARASSYQDWEKFKWIDQGNGSIWLQAKANGEYVGADHNSTNSPLVAWTTNPQSWETFTWGSVN